MLQLPMCSTSGEDDDESDGCRDFFRGDVEGRDAEGGAGRRDQTYQVPAVLIPSEAED
jgi:hypothetical protein